MKENTSSPYSTVTRFALLPNGKIIIGGYFSAVGKVNTYGIARLNADGSIDATFHAPQILGREYSGGYTDAFTITTLDVQPDEKIVFAGYFEKVGGQLRRGIARLNADGSLDQMFNPTLGNALSATPTIADLRVAADGKIYIVGNFSYNSGASRYVARLNTDGTIDSTFNAPAAISSLANPATTVEILPSGKILFAIYSAPGYKIYRLNTDGSIDSSFMTVSVNGTVNVIRAQADGQFYVGGSFTQYNGFPLTSQNLIHLNADGLLDTNFNAGGAGPDYEVKRIDILPNGQLFIGGGFISYNRVSRKNVAKINADGSLDNSFNYTGSRGLFYDSVMLSNGKILIGYQACDYCTDGYAPALVKLNADGTIDAAQTLVGDVGEGYVVYVQPDGKILVGGSYKYADSQRRPLLSRFNFDGTLDTSFITPFTSDSGGVYGIDVRADGKILVSASGTVIRLNSNGSLDQRMDGNFGGGGSYASKFLPGGGAIVSISPSRLRRVSEAGVTDPTFDIGTNAIIKKIIIQPDGKFLVAGDFTTIGGVTRGRIARVNADGTIDSTFNPPGGANAIVYDMVLLPDGKILVGGGFSGINFNTNYKYLARLNSDGTLDTSFNPVISGGVQSLKLQPDGKILIGGGIYAVGGVPIYGIARLNTDGSLDPTFTTGAGINNSVLSIDMQSNGNIVIAGTFTRVNNIDRLGAARLLNRVSTRTLFDFDGDRLADVAVFRPSNGNWYILPSQTNAFYGFPFGQSGDQIAIGDYDGDGKTDVAVFRDTVPGAGNKAYFYIMNSADNSFRPVQFGATGDVPMIGDWDGDGKADLAVYRAAATAGALSYFYYRPSTQPTVDYIPVPLGTNIDKPFIGDFDGDGRIDPGVFRASGANAIWLIYSSSTGGTQTTFGASTDIPVPADYDGDGKAEIAVFRPSTGYWYTSTNPAVNYGAIQFGANGDLPIPADYDGDGKTDVAVFRPSNGAWYLQRSTSGFAGVQFGITGDKPIPNAFIR